MNKSEVLIHCQHGRDFMSYFTQLDIQKYLEENHALWYEALEGKNEITVYHKIYQYLEAHVDETEQRPIKDNDQRRISKKRKNRKIKE